MHAHSLDITSNMDALPFASSAACSDGGLLQWQAVLQWILAARLLEAPLRLPSWLNDDLRPVPRLQLSWASEFNSPVGLLHNGEAAQATRACCKGREPSPTRLWCMGCQCWTDRDFEATVRALHRSRWPWLAAQLSCSSGMASPCAGKRARTLQSACERLGARSY